MAAKHATADERILARMEEAAGIRAGSIIARGSSDKPQAGGMQFDCGILSPYSSSLTPNSPSTRTTP